MLKTSGEAVNIAPMPAAQATATQADARTFTSARRENRDEGKREVERQVVHEKANGTVGVT